MKVYPMYSQELIEVLLEHELKGLCTNCSLASGCTYRKTSPKIIVQCELYQLIEDSESIENKLFQKGLCMNCSRVDSCKLPGKHTGIWHCEEYK
jgi:hypothetical protein